MTRSRITPSAGVKLFFLQSPHFFSHFTTMVNLCDARVGTDQLPLSAAPEGGHARSLSDEVERRGGRNRHASVASPRFWV